MCGIAGVFSFKPAETKKWFDAVHTVSAALHKRGPDAFANWSNQSVSLAHRRLSIIDVSEAANQPMLDSSGKVVIIFNGEIFNYRELKGELEKKGIQFRTASDTEVLLELYKHEGENFISRLNGFFAFSIYDSQKNEMLIARDRYGVKPLYFYQDKQVVAFASEMKAMNCFPIEKEIDHASLALYFQLNYIPQPFSIFKNIRQVSPGNYLQIKTNAVEEKNYYTIPFVDEKNIAATDYASSCTRLENLLSDAVNCRLISDVPLGAFLSGGIDSSVVVALASRFTKSLKTFSIGFKDEPFFDETKYAQLVAEKYKTNHTAFSLTTDDLYGELFSVLDYIDEPFADSSALPVHILSRYTRQHVTVALSGDGADELFGGYMKHVGEWKIRNAGALENLVSALGFVWKNLPQSRNGKMANTIRRLNKLSEGMNMNARDRYWRFASIGGADYVRSLLKTDFSDEEKIVSERKNRFLNSIHSATDMNEVLLADMNLVLPSDMLVKVDRMSMANSLEVRTPFLDYNVVDFAFSLQADFKIKNGERKKIVQDTFRNILPVELYNRPKQGFEVPLLKWFRTGLKTYIDELTETDFIREQNIFNAAAIQKLKQQLHSVNPGDATAKLWAVIVFQHWWKKQFGSR